jgi:DNA-binding NtrC family response regulator
VRVRVIAATNRDLEAARERNEVRDDLFYRLSGFTITLPPLRERAEDIPVLAYHFLRKAEADVNKKVDRISAEALDILKRYAWPGNLRELENIIERAVVLAPKRTIEPAHLPLHLQEPGAGPAEGLLPARDRMARQFERAAVVRLLAESRGNVSGAARLARTTRRNFHRLLKKHGVDARLFRNGAETSARQLPA